MSENIPLKEWLVAAGKANMTSRVSDQYGLDSPSRLHLSQHDLNAIRFLNTLSDTSPELVANVQGAFQRPDAVRGAKRA